MQHSLGHKLIVLQMRTSSNTPLNYEITKPAHNQGEDGPLVRSQQEMPAQKDTKQMANVLSSMTEACLKHK